MYINKKIIKYTNNIRYYFNLYRAKLGLWIIPRDILFKFLEEETQFRRNSLNKKYEQLDSDLLESYKKSYIYNNPSLRFSQQEEYSQEEYLNRDVDSTYCAGVYKENKSHNIIISG